MNRSHNYNDVKRWSLRPTCRSEVRCRSKDWSMIIMRWTHPMQNTILVTFVKLWLMDDDVLVYRWMCISINQMYKKPSTRILPAYHIDGWFAGTVQLKRYLFTSWQKSPCCFVPMKVSRYQIFSYWFSYNPMLVTGCLLTVPGFSSSPIMKCYSAIWDSTHRSPCDLCVVYSRMEDGLWWSGKCVSRDSHIEQLVKLSEHFQSWWF